jgi:hypothetical protein
MINHYRNIYLLSCLFIFSNACIPVKTMSKTDPSQSLNINPVSSPTAGSDNKINEKMIISVPELAPSAEIETFKFTSETNPPKKADLLKKLTDFALPIQKIDLVSLSTYAKEQMKGYKLPDNFLENARVEQVFENKEITVLKLKTADLPSHSPLVKRFLYLIPVYDSLTGEIRKIFITIEGYAEE